MDIKQKAEISESIYDRLLYTLLTCSIATRPALLVLSKNQQSIYQAISKALQVKHIKEYSTSIKVASRRKKITYYGITRAGVNHLSKIRYKLPEDMSWVQTIPWQEKTVSLFGEDRTGTRIYRHLRISTANIFFGSMGAEIWPLFIETNDTVVKTGDWPGNNELESVTVSPEKNKGNDPGVDCLVGIDDAKPFTKPRSIQLSMILKELFRIFEASEQNCNGSIKNPGASIKFTHSRKMSQLLYGDEDSLIAKNTIWGRETGIVESPLKTVLIYTGDKRGMSWSKFHTDIERKEYRQFNAASAYHNIALDNGLTMLIVDNPKMFADLFFDTKGKRHGEPFGGNFASMIVVPDNRAGIENAYQYLMTDTKLFYKSIIDDAIQSGGFMKRAGKYDSIFPLQDVKGTSIAIGVYIDGIQIGKIKEAAGVLRKPIGVICYEWQREYYRRVLSDTKFIIMENKPS